MQRAKTDDSRGEEQQKKQPAERRQAAALLLVWMLAGLYFITGCGGAGEGQTTTSAAGDGATAGDAEMLTLPDLEEVTLAGRPLEVVATSSIIGDVVAAVGGEAIRLTVLMAPGQDPHGYEPSTRDLAGVADADVVFVNGWGLEEGILGRLENVAEYGPLVPVSAGIRPRVEGDGVDAHVWLDPTNVEQWVQNVQAVLSTLDPENAATYEANTGAYLVQLEELDEFLAAQAAAIPASERLLVTNHDSLGYFAARYGFTVVGTVLPGTSSGAEPSARELAVLAEQMDAEGVCTIFLEGTADASLAEAVREEVAGCDDVQIRELYTGALGLPGSPAGTYIGMMHTNMALISEALGG